MNDEHPEAVPTVLSRMHAAGITTERITEHFRAGRITVDGDLAHGLDQPAPPPARIVFH
jgi:hypothetical protein